MECLSPSVDIAVCWVEDLFKCSYHGVCDVGPIPPQLGDLADLETLDLSSNKLTGEL